MKKIIYIILSFIILFSLSSCENIDLSFLNQFGINVTTYSSEERAERLFYEYALEYGYDGTYEEFDTFIRNGIDDLSAKVESYEVLRTVKDKNIIKVTFSDGSTSTIALSSEKNIIDEDSTNENNNKTDVRTFKKISIIFYDLGEDKRSYYAGETLGDLPTPYKEGYDFIGWYTADGKLVTGEDTFYNDITLYARFEEDPFDQEFACLFDFDVDEEGYIHILHYNGDCEIVNIPMFVETENNEYKVAYIECGAFNGSCARNVYLPDSMIRIEDDAFSWSQLETIELGNNLEFIGCCAFMGCFNLREITIPGSVDIIEKDAFSECYNLETVTIEKGVQNIFGYFFANCNSLLNINYTGTVEDWNNVYKDELYLDNNTTLKTVSCCDGIVNLVRDCDYYTYELINKYSDNIRITGYTGNRSNLIIPYSIDNYTIVEIKERAFEGRNDITSIEIQACLNSIGSYAFSECTSLNLVSISNIIDTISDNAFSGCINLIQVGIYSECNTISDYAFNGCTNLNYVNLPQGLDYIGEYAFANCPNLFTIYYQSSMDNWESINKHVTWNFNSNNISMDYAIKYRYTVNENNEATLTEYYGNEPNLWIPYYIDGHLVTKIGNSLFMNNQTIVRVYIEDGIKEIGDYAFSGCTNLSNIELPISVTKIGDYAFYNCSNLIQIYYMGYVGDWNNVSLGNNWKENASNLRVVCQGQYSYSYNEDGTLKLCGYVEGIETSIYIQETYNGERVTTIGKEVFAKKDSILTVEISDSIVEVGEYAFYYCENLYKVFWGENVEIIKEGTFKNCSTLNTIDLKSHVERIEQEAFYGCSSLESIELPSSIKYIGTNAFKKSGLKTIVYNGTKAQWSKVEGLDNISSSITVICSDGIY